MELTAKEVGAATNLSSEMIRHLRRQKVITGTLRGNVLFFAPETITIINNRKKNYHLRGRKKKEIK